MSTKPAENQYKVIIAIKCVKELNLSRVPMVRCCIDIQDNEGQFFDLREIDVTRPIQLTFTLEKTNKEIGTTFVNIPEDVLSREEVEIADEFAFEYADKEFEGIFRGSYYIIILNKHNFIQRDDSRRKQVEENKKSSSSSKPQKSKKSPTTKPKEDDLRLQSSAKRLQDKVDSTVKLALKEIQASKEELDTSVSLFRVSSQSKQTPPPTQNDSPSRISQQVQLTRSGTLVAANNDSMDMKRSTSPQTFNYDESSPSRKSNQSLRGLHTSHNAHNHTNLSCLYFIDQAHQSDQMKTQSDYLKKIIHNLQTKMDVMKEAEKSTERLEVELHRSELRHKEMEKLVREAQERTKQVRLDATATIDEMLADRVDLQQGLRAKQAELSDAVAQITNLQFQAEQHQIQLQQLERRLAEAHILTRHVKQQDTKLDDLDKKAQENLRHYETRLKELGAAMDTLEKTKLTQQGDLNKNQQQINGLKQELGVAAQKHKELAHLHQCQERQVQVGKAHESTVMSLQGQLQMLTKDVQEVTRQKGVSERDAGTLKKENLALKQLQLDCERQMGEIGGALRSKILELEGKIAQGVSDQEAHQKANLCLRHEMASQQLSQQVVDDLLLQVEEEKSRSEAHLKHSKEGQLRERDLQSLLQGANQSLLTTRQQLTDLQQVLVETQTYGHSLKKLILEMKESGVAYLPYHNDPIDKALADFINSMNDPSRTIGMFVRESEGVYLFGTKKVYIKVEQDRILIRTGGGFMGIEEFLDAFVHVEAEKLRDQDPKKDYDRNQVLNRTIDQAKVIKQIKSQTSPLKNRTPTH